MKQETTLFNKESPIVMMAVKFGLKGGTSIKIIDRLTTGSHR